MRPLFAPVDGAAAILMITYWSKLLHLHIWHNYLARIIWLIILWHISHQHNLHACVNVCSYQLRCSMNRPLLKVHIWEETHTDGNSLKDREAQKSTSICLGKMAITAHAHFKFPCHVFNNKLRWLYSPHSYFLWFLLSSLHILGI